MKPREPKNLLGVKWARLEVVAFLGLRDHAYYWKCLCSCGGSCELRTTQITRKRTKSCGCLVTEGLVTRSRTYGEGRSSLAAVWRAMIARCHNPNSRAYKWYGAKGVSVCERWRMSFLTFKEDIGPPPSGTNQLDRYPNKHGNYEPGNVRWTSSKGNQRNRANNVTATVNGVTKTLVQWAEETGIPYKTLWQRHSHGWSDESVVTVPVR